jgi:hypothetical protein
MSCQLPVLPVLLVRPLPVLPVLLVRPLPED